MGENIVIKLFKALKPTRFFFCNTNMNEIQDTRWKPKSNVSFKKYSWKTRQNCLFPVIAKNIGSKWVGNFQT